MLRACACVVDVLSGHRWAIPNGCVSMEGGSNAAEYDVVICGAGYAGVCCARHLKLKRPELRVALVDQKDSCDREDGKWKA